jgi:hypothetical protein
MQDMSDETFDMHVKEADVDANAVYMPLESNLGC